MSKLKSHIAFIVVLAISFVVRLLAAINHSYSNDELSAISRLRYSDFGSLIELGVMKGDMHPAGVQIFMKFWSIIGGTGEVWMRLPFIFCGVFSLWVIYLIGIKWFKSQQTGLLAVIMLGFLFFPILHTELARPYSPGLMFALLVAWYFHKVLFCEVKKKIHVVLLGVAFAGAMYTHYFAFLFVLFIGFTGLFFLNKSNYRQYLLAAFLGALLYLPHIQVTLFHLSAGGLQWLGKPTNSWLVEFLIHSLNSSWIVIGVVIVGLILSLLTPESQIKEKPNRYFILCLVWFSGIYGIGHLVSLVGTPVLKFPVMLFAFPFLILLIASQMTRFRYSGWLISVTGAVMLWSTLFEVGLLGNHHFGLFKELAEKTIAWEDEYGEENLYKVINVNSPDYLNFYATRHNRLLELDRDVLDYGDEHQLRDELKNRKEPYCVLGYSARNTVPQVFETVREFYPSIVEYDKYTNSALFLLSRDDVKNDVQSSEKISVFNENEFDGWIKNDNFFRSDSSGNYYLLDRENKYGPEYHFKLNQLKNLEGSYFKVEVNGELTEDAGLTITVSGFRNGELIPDGQGHFWMGFDVENQLLDSKKGYFAFKFPPFLRPDDELIISLWNRHETTVKIKTVSFIQKENIWN